MFGLLNFYKPAGISSYDVIRRLRRPLGRQVKLGHAGTLDPLAEGVLVVCVGPATRLARLVQSRQKEYVVTAELGAVSSTDDAEGQLEPTAGAAAPTREAVEVALGGFVGRIEQVPPAHSAVKVAGQRAYKLARRGQAPKMTARPVTVEAIEVLAYEYPRLRLRVVCGTGTYIRSLVRDIGAQLGTGGYCRELIRTRVGPFRAEQAARMDSLAAPSGIEAALIPPIEAVPPEARVKVTTEDIRSLAQGRAVAASAELAAAGESPEELGAVGPGGRLVALLRYDRAKQLLRPAKVFVGKD